MTTKLTRLLSIAATLGLVLPPFVRRSVTEKDERTDADRAALTAAEEKRARKAAKRLARS